MSSNSEDNSQIQVYTEVLNENIGNTLFIEYFENNNFYMEPFKIFEQASNGRIQINRIYDSTTITKDLSNISTITKWDDEKTRERVDTVLNIDNFLADPAYQMILSGSDDYIAFHEKKFLSSNGCNVPMESIYLSIKLGYNNYNDVLTADIDDLKTKWKALINAHKNKAVDILTVEKTQCQNDGNTDDVEEIEVILTLLNDLTSEIDEEMAELTDRDSVLKYWPPLLLPAPSYLV
tara:strand:- start:914 stop:1618 length:705 start_codon:yes stop_codon:yes gene_type:complete